jgi:hypothetical protein
VTGRFISLGILAGASLLGGGCGKGGQEPSPPPDQLRQLMHANGAETPPPPPPSRLALLRPADVDARFQGRPACRLVHDADTLLIARDGVALARIDGRVATIAQSGPVDRSGAFFRGPGITISIGGGDPHAGGPAGVTVSGRGDDPPQRLQGVWSCTG